MSHLLMLTGDGAIAQGQKGVFYEVLSELSNHWERISVICPSNEIGEEIRLFDNTYLFPSKHSKRGHLDVALHKKFIIKKAKEIFADNPFHVISAHAIPPFFIQVEAAKVLKRTFPGLKFVTELHHIPGYPNASGFAEKILQLSLDTYIKANKANLDIFRIVNSSEVGSYLRDKIKLDQNKINLVPSMYINFDKFKAAKNKKGNQFIWAGRLEKNKGLFLLVDGFAKAYENNKNIRLKIVGDGSLKDKLKTYIEKKNLSDAIEMTGWLKTQADVAEEMAKSTALLLTSFNEGGPRVCLEAMACSTAIISVNIGLVKELVKHRENGLVIDWSPEDIAEKILWSVNNPKQLQEIANAGQKTAQQFEYKKMIKNYADFYLKIAHDE